MSYVSFARTTFSNMLGTLERLVDKAQEAGFSEDVLDAKLTEDMFTLELQFRVALNQVLLALQQVAGDTGPLDAETYGSFTEVRDRIAAIRARIEASAPEDWMAPEAEVDLTLPNGVRFVMSAEDDIRDWILPNFYFHVTMAYALLRKQGLQVGKMDFLPHMARHIRQPAD